MKSRRWRTSWMLAGALLGWVSALAAQNSRPAKQYSLSISRGSLVAVLDQFSKQTGLQVGADLNTPDERNREVGPIIGRVTPDTALKQLLDGSDLTFAWEDQYTVRIYNGIVRPRAEDNVPEVLVTGTRLSGAEEPALVRVYGRGNIELYGVSTISGLSRYFTQQPFAFNEGHMPSGAQHFQMRGLGWDTTLVLINGRRVPASANSIAFNAFDLNTVPLTAVDRIEVMSDSASAIYGADAVGAVVNIILKKEVEQPEVYMHYGAAAGGGDEQRISGAIGTSSERLKSIFMLDYLEHGWLIGKQRDLWSNQDFRRFGGQDYRASTANPGSVYSLNGQALPGLTSTYAAIPVGSSGVGLTPADFTSTAGATNLYSTYRELSILPESYRTTAYGSIEFELNPRLALFGELLAGNSSVTSQRSLPWITREVVPETNPFNPFGVPVAVDYAFVGMDPISQRTESEIVRLVSGARGRVRGWDWEVAAVVSEEDVSTVVANELDRSRVQAALRSEDPTTALNLFRDGPAGSDELLASIVADSLRRRFSSGSSQLSGFFRGPLFQRTTGAAELVIGGEWRREAVEFFDLSRVMQERDVASAFAEVKVPLLDKLSLKVAFRGDLYADISDALNPQYGVVWKPSDDWLLRAAYGTSFRPPSLYELHAPRLELPSQVADPRRGGAVSNVNLIVGGNPELDVVTAQSFTTGIVYTPSQLQGVRLGGTYWRVVMDNRITVPQIAELLNPDSEFSDRVTRFEPDNQDLQAGRPGALRSLDLRRLNHGRLETSGVDLEMSYLLQQGLGSLETTLAATWVGKYISDDMRSALPSDRVGVANVTGTIPEWRVVGTLTWKLHGFGASSTVTFTPSYQDTDLTGVLDRRLPSRTLLDLQAWLELGSVFSEDSLFAGSKLTLGMLNALDEAPDFAHAGLMIGYDLSQADMTQRFAYLRLSKRFR